MRPPIAPAATKTPTTIQPSGSRFHNGTFATGGGAPSGLVPEPAAVDVIAASSSGGTADAGAGPQLVIGGGAGSAAGGSVPGPAVSGARFASCDCATGAGGVAGVGSGGGPATERSGRTEPQLEHPTAHDSFSVEHRGQVHFSVMRAQ